MSREEARTVFTKDEIAAIEALVRQLYNAPSDKQKGIRSKIRRIGLYWSEVAGGMSYTVENLHRLINNGAIKVVGLKPAVTTAPTPLPVIPTVKAEKPASGGRATSDEYYVVGLCNEVLGLTAQQQYKFPFLLGDIGRALPVDAYYESLNLVVEYYEKQHTESVRFFDKKMTVSGVSRGEQRKIYDERRRTELPKHGIKLVVINYTDFGESKKLLRNHAHDIEVVRRLLKANKVIK